MSKLPIGGITSWQAATHKDEPDKPVFGRDLLEVEIYNATRSKKLFTIFNNHLKSHFVAWQEDQEKGEKNNNERRARQAEVMARIVKARTRPNSSFIVLGDMNDPPDSEYLCKLVDDTELNLVNALVSPKETRPPKRDEHMPASKAWTHRYKEPKKPAKYELYDQIWFSPAMADMKLEAWIDRRRRHGGDGSDHDPAWVKFQL